MSFRFVRHTDGLAYEFRREPEPAFDHPSFRRADLELFCRRLPEFGWCVVDSAGRVLSRPFDDAGVGELPPGGVWVSRKGDTSYVYDLVEDMEVDVAVDDAPPDLVAYIDGHRDDTALVVLRGDDPTPVVSVSPDEPMPLASVRKVLVLLAVARAMAMGTLDPGAPVPMPDVERWYAPGTDGGAHVAAVAALGAVWTVAMTAQAMITHSDNAATDWLLDAVGGPSAVDVVIDGYAMPHQDPAWPLLGEFLAWARDPEAWLGADAAGRRDLALSLVDETPAGPVSITPPALDVQRRLALATCRGTAAAWAALLQAVVSRAAAGDPAAAYALGVLSWPLADPDTAAAFPVFATKGGSLAGVAAEASVVQAVGGEILTVVQFYRDVPEPFGSTMTTSYLHQMFLARLALEPAFLDEVTAVLGIS